ncbi:hypothetical protein SAMN05877831_10241 [Rhodobacter maris]|uniref:Uncharacterized protein n=1 Tax=Rhodobacter maris TaxID=446682 RepID=A0A285RWK5_9RHOB|nr:hypothetical protein SAMN05877831_10241 [Rhodobacter maris]
MDDHGEILARLRRPKLLIHAARFGQRDYRRDRDLRRILGVAEVPAPAAALAALIAQEAALETARQAGAAQYSFLHQVELLIAILAESRARRAQRDLKSEPSTPRTSACPALAPSCRASALPNTSATESEPEDAPRRDTFGIAAGVEFPPGT